jgi:hypothetical protein
MEQVYSIVQFVRVSSSFHLTTFLKIEAKQAEISVLGRL